MPRVLVLVLVVATSGCGYAGLDDLPLPGGPDVGRASYTVTADFDDVLNLTRQTTVKADGVTIGRVDTITRHGWDARVSMRLRRDVRLPADVEARVAQTSLLGEKFVDLTPDRRSAAAPLADGAHVPVARTSRGTEVEEVLGSLSLLLNGGGVAQLRSITREMHQALDGDTVDTRRFLRQLDTFVGTLDRNRSRILTTLENVDSLTSQIDDDRATVERALVDIGPAVEILADQRKQLRSMLRQVDRFSRTATDVVRTAGDDLAADLAALEPTLAQLEKSGDTLPQALEAILSFPFPDEVLEAVKGDYVNLDVRLDLSALEVLKDVGNLPVERPPVTGTDLRGGDDLTPPRGDVEDDNPLAGLLPDGDGATSGDGGLSGLLGLLLGGGS